MYPKSTTQLGLVVSRCPGFAQDLNTCAAVQREFLPGVGDNDTSDPYGRNFAGMPPAKTGDYAWVQPMIKSMAARTGRMAVVLPHGALFRTGKEVEIRKKIL